MKTTTLWVGVIGVIVIIAIVLLVMLVPGNDGVSRRDQRLGNLPSGEQQPDGSDTMTQGLAPVETIDVVIAESFPVQVFVTVSGNLADGCTTITSDQISQRREGNTFYIVIPTERPENAMCTQALVPWQQRFALDVQGFEAGTYTVDVNGVTERFVLEMDNMIDVSIEK